MLGCKGGEEGTAERRESGIMVIYPGESGIGDCSLGRRIVI